jgi:hypothetical protein
MKLIQEFLTRRLTTTVYHYTDASGLIGIARDHSVWATSHLHLNDSMEHKTARGFLNAALAKTTLSPHLQETFVQLLKQSEIPVFVASFSEDRDLLSQWRAYCGTGQGYSIGFAPDNALFDAAKGNAFSLVKCVYDEEEQESLADTFVSTFEEEYWSQQRLLVGEQNQADPAINLRAIVRRYNWSYAFALFISTCKHKSFAGENEWRLISQYPDDDKIMRKVLFRPGRFGVVPFFPIPLGLEEKNAMLDSITVGPSADRNAARGALIKLYKTCFSTNGSSRIAISEIPYRP